MPDLEAPIVAPEASATPALSAEPAPADDFDKDRAMETIRKLREVEKNAKAQARELAELKAKEQERANAELSESDRLKKQLADAQAKASAAEARLHQELIKNAVASAAIALQLPFTNTAALEDAVALGAFADLTMGDDGKVAGVNEAIRAVQKVRPYLFGQPTTNRPPNINASARNGGGDLIDNDAELARKRLDPRYS